MRRLIWVFLALCLLRVEPASAATSQEEVEVLRNTVVNLLEALVAEGVLTPETVQTMVADAQADAEATALARREQEEAEKDAVRVTYVPENVRRQIGEEVAATVTGDVVEEVIARAQEDQWGVPGALPDWIQRFDWFGDVRMRAEGLLYDDGNAENFYRNFLEINRQGGFFGPNTVLNTTEDRYRVRVRARIGFIAGLPNRTTVGLRLATGDLESPTSTTTTLGNYGRRRDFSLDMAYINFDRGGHLGLPLLSATAGRMPNPWYTTDLAFDRDLNFDGLTVIGRLPVGSRPLVAPHRSGVSNSHLFLGVGSYTLEEIELSGDDKRFHSAQLGAHLAIGDRWQYDLGFAYHNFENVTGRRNEPNSNLLDFTAPAFLTNGNTVFDIRNDTDPNTALFALASDFDIVTGTTALTWRNDRNEVRFEGEYLTNIGYDEEEILERTGVFVPERADGYRAELSYQRFGDRGRLAWYGGLAYKSIQRDAMIDGFTESVIRRGGTDIEGWIATGGFTLSDNSSVQIRWVSADEIDGAPYALDTVQLDILTAF